MTRACASWAGHVLPSGDGLFRAAGATPPWMRSGRPSACSACVGVMVLGARCCQFLLSTAAREAKTADRPLNDLRFSVVARAGSNRRPSDVQSLDRRPARSLVCSSGLHFRCGDPLSPTPSKGPVSKPLAAVAVSFRPKRAVAGGWGGREIMTARYVRSDRGWSGYFRLGVERLVGALGDVA